MDLAFPATTPSWPARENWGHFKSIIQKKKDKKQAKEKFTRLGQISY
jgi:hypothetical protein